MHQSKLIDRANLDPAFKAWFAGSDVVTAGGHPKLMFHGSLRQVEWFDRRKSLEWRRPSMDTVGSWFSDNPNADGGAGMYAQGPGAVIYPVFLRIERPKISSRFRDFLRDMHAAEGRDVETQNPPGIGSPDGLRQQLAVQGYDGLMFERTRCQDTLDSIADYAEAIERAKREEFSVGRAAREPFTMKRLRLEADLAQLRSDFKAAGSSTEFDKQEVWVAFESAQVCSALGERPVFVQRENQSSREALGMVQGMGR